MRALSWSIAGCMVFASLALSGCGGGTATATERLWISGLPSKPTAKITAFATTRTGDGKYLGAFFEGTVLRGGHDVFEWTSTGTDRATLKFLQDGTKADISWTMCAPTTGFDYCLQMKGDPTGTKKYQSRKRWVVKRPGKRKDASGMALDVMAELAEDDEDLAVYFAEE
jgi:hypothetical protein